MATDLREHRRHLIATCRDAARAQRDAGELATEEHEEAVCAALTALHEFDGCHPELADPTTRPLEMTD